MDPLVTLGLPGLSLCCLAGSALVYALTERRRRRAWRELAAADDAFRLRLREARIRPSRREEEEPDLAWEGYRKFRIVRKVIEDTKAETASFYFAPIDGRRLPGYPPGAYLNIRVDIPEHGSEARSYSISSSFRQDCYRLSIKRVPGSTDPNTGKVLPPGLVSNFVHDHVHEGSTIDISAPQHCPHFVLDMEQDFPVVLLGAGVGITPMICMWEEVVSRQPTRPVWLFYGVRGSDELMDSAGNDSALPSIMRQVSDEARLWLCFSAVKEVKDASGRVVGLTGGADGDRLLCEATRRRMLSGERPRILYHHGRVAVKPWIWNVLPARFKQEAHFYTCGPGPFMKGIREDLRGLGVPERRIHFEEFGADSHDAMTEVVDTKCEVTFTRGGRSKPVAWEGWRRDLQRLASANGVPIRGSCGVGACGECETPILAGKVQHTRDPLPWTPTPGCCLPCVAVPHPDCERLELQA